MSLKLTLKPHERIIIGGAVICNGNKTSEISIENNVPLLRQKDIMTEATADSPARRIYFAIQLMYIDRDNMSAYLEKFMSLTKDITEAAPSTCAYITQITELMAAGKPYQALKIARQLIEYEKELLTNG